MRFKFDLEQSVLLSIATYVLYLGLTEKLSFYIHPRYINFTLALSAIAVLLLLVNKRSSGHAHDHGRTRRLSLLPLVFVVSAALVLPARALTSATFSQRTTDAGSIVTTAEARPTNALFAGSSKGLRLADWARLLAANNDPSYYASRPADVTGFVYDAGLGDDTVWLARFVVTCCAVDAQPIGVPVRLEGWRADYEEDEWVRVEGEFGSINTLEGEMLVLVPESANKVDQPGNPYAN